MNELPLWMQVLGAIPLGIFMLSASAVLIAFAVAIIKMAWYN